MQAAQDTWDRAVLATVRQSDWRCMPIPACLGGGGAVETLWVKEEPKLPAGNLIPWPMDNKTKSYLIRASSLMDTQTSLEKAILSSCLQAQEPQLACVRQVKGGR